jgi:hypothetical protein
MVRRAVWALATLLIVVSGLLAVPEVRAALRSFLHIGAIEIVLPTPTPAMEPSPTADTTPTAIARPTLTLTPLTSVLDLAGETTLEEAGTDVKFPIQLPSYPPDLGPPDRVFVQDLGGPAVILVWLDPQEPDRVALSLHQLSADAFGQKFAEERTVIEHTTVNTQPAVWLRGPHVLQFKGGLDGRRLVNGNVLIWQDGDLTYRLETELPLEEAVRIAESLR